MLVFNTSDLLRRKPPVMVVFPASVSASHFLRLRHVQDSTPNLLAFVTALCHNPLLTAVVRLSFVFVLTVYVTDSLLLTGAVDSLSHLLAGVDGLCPLDHRLGLFTLQPFVTALCLQQLLMVTVTC